MVKIGKWECYNDMCRTLGYPVENPMTWDRYTYITETIEEHGGLVNNAVDSIVFNDEDFLIFKLKYGVHNGR